jgi:antitoxin VapB
MTTAKLFMNGRSQAVRLPKEFRFQGGEVLVKQFGGGVLLLPRSTSWDEWFDGLEAFPRDFMRERKQPVRHERREALG